MKARNRRHRRSKDQQANNLRRSSCGIGRHRGRDDRPRRLKRTDTGRNSFIFFHYNSASIFSLSRVFRLLCFLWLVVATPCRFVCPAYRHRHPFLFLYLFLTDESDGGGHWISDGSVVHSLLCRWPELANHCRHCSCSCARDECKIANLSRIQWRPLPVAETSWQGTTSER